MTKARRVDVAIALGLALVIVGPLLLGSGYWLVGDMVFVPHQPWKSAWLGLDGALPRAVPMDALVSLVTTVLPGSVLQRVLLVGGLAVGGVGIGRLLADRAWYARAGAIVLFCWNPWVAERLAIGQWAILLGYLVLPYVAFAARRLRHDPRAWRAAAVPLVVAAVCSPSSGLMALGTLLVLGGTRSSWWRVLAVGTAANATWLVASLAAARTDITGDDGVFAGFAARAESSAGVFASVLSLGGIWKSSIVPVERTGAVLVLLSCLLSVAALAGLAGRAGVGRPHHAAAGEESPQEREGRVEARRLALLGGASLAIALVPVGPVGTRLLTRSAELLPALAMLRDSQRFLAPLGLVLAVGVAATLAWLRRQVAPGREAVWALIGLVVLAPVLLLPSLAWGLAGDLQRSTYPAGWDVVAERIADGPGATVVLPWAGSYRGFEWNHRRAVLDPAPRYLPGEVVIDDRVILDDAVVPAEDPRVREIDAALAAADPDASAAALRAVGVRWVLVETDAGSEALARVAVPTGTTVVDSDGLRLVDLGEPDDLPASRPTATSVLVLIGHGTGVLLLFLGLARILPTRE